MFKNYTERVLLNYKKCEEAETLSLNLRNPTPAGLREECLHVYKEKGLPKDEVALRSFFGPLNGDVDYLQRIENIDIDKFRPLVNLLKGKINHPSKKNIELLEWLIGKENKIEANAEKKKLLLKWKNKVSKGILAIAIIGVFGGITYVTTKPKYMYWNGEKYESMVFYRNMGDTLVLEFDQNIFDHLKRITKPDTITEKNLSKVWYVKVNVDSADFYTSGGAYPLDTSKILKPATAYIIDKYITK